LISAFLGNSGQCMSGRLRHHLLTAASGGVAAFADGDYASTKHEPQFGGKRSLSQAMVAHVNSQYFGQRSSSARVIVSAT
jgi:hypothetical protein